MEKNDNVTIIEDSPPNPSNPPNQQPSDVPSPFANLELTFSVDYAKYNGNLIKVLTDESYGGFYYGWDGQTHFLSLSFVRHHFGDDAVMTHFKRVFKVSFRGAKDDECKNWRAFDLKTANDILFSCKVKQTQEEFEQLGRDLREIFEKNILTREILVCLDPKVPVNIGNKEEIIQGLYLAIRVDSYIVPDPSLIYLSLQAAIQVQEKQLEDESHVYRAKYLPLKYEEERLTNHLANLKTQIHIMRAKRVTLERRIANLKKGSFEIDNSPLELVRISSLPSSYALPDTSLMYYHKELESYASVNTKKAQDAIALVLKAQQQFEEGCYSTQDALEYLRNGGHDADQ